MQDFQHFEIIVVDDGSTDRGAEIVKSVTDQRIHLIHQPNSGPSNARNVGSHMAKAPWIYFLDADDEALPGAFTHFLKLAHDFPEADIIDCNRTDSFNKKINSISKPKLWQGKHIFKAWFYHIIFPGQDASLFKKELVLKCPYDERLRRFEDADMLFRMLKIAIVCKDQVSVCRIHNEDSHASRPRRNVMEDFFGHLSPFKGHFWERMCRYRFYLNERDNYRISANKLYPFLRFRLDLLIINKILFSRSLRDLFCI